jgi:putative transposase
VSRQRTRIWQERPGGSEGGLGRARARRPNSHEAVRDREAKLAPVLSDELRRRRRGKGSASRRSWFVDETYLKVRGRWCYLYRAIDRNGDLVDTMLSEHRDMAAA